MDQLFDIAVRNQLLGADRAFGFGTLGLIVNNGIPASGTDAGNDLVALDVYDIPA